MAHSAHRPSPCRPPRRLLARRGSAYRSSRIRLFLVALGAGLALVSGSPEALEAQYIAPGTELASSIVTDETELRASFDDAPLKVGAVRLSPWAGLRDAAVVDTATTTENDTDFTATLGAGIRAYLRSGPKILWAAHVMPEYVYWQNNDAKRRLNGRLGVGFFAYLNRLELEISARRNESQSFFSSEVQELTSIRDDILRAAFSLEIIERVALLGSYEREEIRSQEEETPLFSLLDRDQDTASLSLRYRSPRGWYAGLGYEESVRDFTQMARNLSHDSEAGFIDLGYEGNRFSMAMHLAAEELRPDIGSEFAAVDTTSGFLETNWNMTRTLDLAVYARRRVQFSTRSEFSSFLNDRLGARLGFNGRRAGAQLIAEIGQDDFDSVTAFDRVDDVLSLGFEYRLQVRRFFDLHLSLLHTDYDSNLDGFDRQVTSWNASIEFNTLRDKFRIGDGDRTW